MRSRASASSGFIVTPLLLLAGLVTLAAFGIYLGVLYRQLTVAFTEQDEFVPTRIYSDVTRIAAPQPRTQIEGRLKALAYKTQSSADSITFTLHPIEYPSYLVPEGHPVVTAGENPVTLRFDSEGKGALLVSIELGGQEIPEVYLEPELVATLGREAGSKSEIRKVLTFNEIPAQVWQAVIAVEDQYFLEHKGFSLRGLARAVWVNLKSLSFRQGGSTITQQLVKNLLDRKTKNVFKKMNEFFLALLLEVRFSKEEILARYLNEVDLGQIGNLEIHGVAEGAEHFFGKRLEDLNLGEIALMAGMLKSAHYYSPYKHLQRALERQKIVLAKMVETGMIADEEAKEAARLPIRLAPPKVVVNKAPFFTDFVKAELIRHLTGAASATKPQPDSPPADLEPGAEGAETAEASPEATAPPAADPAAGLKMTEEEVAKGGFRVYSTLDPIMNSAAQKAVADGVARLEASGVAGSGDRLEGALASVDHTTGYIRALVGGRSYAQSNFNRILNMKRQVGSTFKPFVYLASFEKGLDPNSVPYGPGHPAEDAPWTLVYDGGRQTWTPRNYEKGFMGWTTHRRALAHSINTIAARLGHEVGVANIVVAARALGIDSPLPQVPSLSLGVAELSPIELLRAYATVANHGMRDDLTVIRAITKSDGSRFAEFFYRPKQVIDPGSADLLSDMMTSVFIEGTASSARKLGFERPAAGKTGTTNDHRDAWFAGFTPQLTTVVWIGTDQQHAQKEEPAEKGKKAPPKKKARLSGGGSALPIWVDYMNEALAGEPPASFPASPHLVDVTIDLHTGKLARGDCPVSWTVAEKYIRDKEPKEIACEPEFPASVPKTVAP